MPELEKGRTIFVTGTPGTGKTTLSRLLVRCLDADYVRPDLLLTRKGIEYTYDPYLGTRVLRLERLRKLLITQTARASRGLVVDTHIVFKIGPPLRLSRAIVLRCNPDVLERRLKQKKWPRHKVTENLLAEILDICLWDAVQNYGWRSVSEIDTTHKTPEETLDLALATLEQKKAQKKPMVDWLSTLKRQRALERYLV